MLEKRLKAMMVWFDVLENPETIAKSNIER